jgi:KUP system potassium uptake protein
MPDARSTADKTSRARPESVLHERPARDASETQSSPAVDPSDGAVEAGASEQALRVEPLPHAGTKHVRPSLILGALGVVFGDIGTSPLYTLRQCVNELGRLDQPAVLGVLSLIAWSLFVVVTLKYVLVVMQADNRGEGGILALTALALRTTRALGRGHVWIIAAGIVGAALFYGDGVITPAISVLSAVEGLKVATPLLDPYVLPITVALLIGLFLLQSSGTGRVGNYFGPIVLVWFVVLAVLGLAQIVRVPGVLLALDPRYGLSLLFANPREGFVLLGSVVLAVTGAEALYADMGHFGRRPIRAAWLWLVFPALLLNYFGQGALLIRVPAAVDNPFYHLAPDWALYPLVVLASAATIIASQAVISGAFSITRQAIQLGYLPRMEVRHTSAAEIGQVYVPAVNWLLLVAVIAVVLHFGSSDRLGWAYGIAVTGTMSITTLLALVYTAGSGRWNPLLAGLVFAFFLIVDLAFFGSNLLKIAEGGWFPIVVAALVFILISTWRRGRQAVTAARARDAMPLADFIARLGRQRLARVPGTAIFLTGNVGLVPNALLHNLKHNKVLHERVVAMTVRTEDIPRVPEAQRLDIAHLDGNFHTIVVHYGFQDDPDIPAALGSCAARGLHFNLMDTSFFVGREKIVGSGRWRLGRWRTQLFIFLSNTMLDAIEFFRIPTNRVVELGGQVEI